MRLKTLLGALTVALLVPAAVLAQPDFTRYVAIGDSLTAGFQSGSLVVTGQRNSYPVLIYRQATGQSTGFEQPLVSEPGIPGQLELRSLVPLVIAPRPGQGSPTNPLITRPYNNLGVPGARLRDTLVTVTGGLHDVVLQTFSPVLRGTTALQQAVSLNPTFVTIWIGNNDALAAATSGRVIEGVTLTPAAQFDADFRALVAAVATQTSARMAIATIPDVTVIPFVNTVPSVVTVNGQQITLRGPDGPLAAGDRVLLPASSLISQGVGITSPLPDELVLSAAEISTISSRIQAFNNTIRAVANERNAALVDTNAFLTASAQGRLGVGGIAFTPAFLTGGVFSLDGVHPTPLGYAFVANEFITAINDKFNGRIPLVNLFPFVFSATGPTTAAATAPAPAPAKVTAADVLPEPTPDFIFTEEARQSLLTALRIDPNPKSPGDENGGTGGGGGKGGKGGKGKGGKGGKKKGGK